MFEVSEFSNWAQAREKNLEEKVKQLEEQLKTMQLRYLSANRSMREMAWLITGLVIKDMKGTTKFERNIVGGETDFTYTIEIDNNQFIGKSAAFQEAQMRAYQDFLYRISTVYSGTEWSKDDLDRLSYYYGDLQ